MAESTEDEDEKLYSLTVEQWRGERPCCSRRNNRALHGISIRCIDKRRQFIEYFGVDGDTDNQKLVFITGAHRIWEITITGRNLERLADYIKEKRIDWIREAEEDFYRDGQLYIARIAVKPLPLKQDVRPTPTPPSYP